MSMASSSPSSGPTHRASCRRSRTNGPPSAELAIGDRIAATDMEVARRIAALTPTFLGSTATSLETRITEKEGFVLHALPKSWRAVFGIYAPTLRGPDLVEVQAQCLSSVLAGQEADDLGRLPLPGRRPLRHVPAEDRVSRRIHPGSSGTTVRRVGRMVERGHGCRW